MNIVLTKILQDKEHDPYYTTPYGKYFLGESESILNSRLLEIYRGKVKLIFTSPPFPLNRKKRYGNCQGEDYIKWLSGFAKLFVEFLTYDGSIVLELGNAWNPSSPTTSTLPLESLLKFKEQGNLHLCQEFIYYNPARLPGPVQWVNKERIRVKDAFTRLWWLSPITRPNADNRRILIEYSKRMENLLNTKKYNSGKRPSEHVIGKNSFLKNNGGSIPSNVIIATNTKAKDIYLEYCREKNLEPHPARMPEVLASFFIKFLTLENDVVLDPFAGSNITGYVAEKLKRNWISIDINENYALGSMGRFLK